MTNLRILAAVAGSTLTIAMTCPAVAQSQANSGAGDTKTGNGFGCATGTSYQMSNGIARCTQPTMPAMGASACAASVLTQGACSFSFPSTTSGSTPSISTSTAGYTGAAQATCSSGTWGGFAATCGPNPCAAKSATYGACSFDLPAVASGSSPTVSTSTGGYAGVGQATCTSGVWSPLAASCAPSGCGGTSSSYGACSFTIPALASGQSTTLANTSQSYTGSETVSCITGTMTFSGQSCAASPPSACLSGTMSWGAGCSAPIAGVGAGSSATLTNAAAGFTGSATFACAAGTWGSPSGVSCNPTAPSLIACPASIWVTSANKKLPLTVPTPADTLPNGHSYCLYSTTVGDRYAGVFDRVAGEAVDFFPIFKEVPDWSGDTNNSTFVFQKYEPRYSSNLHIQGAYCANNLGDPNQKGFYPGTCADGGHGGFAPMCFVEMSPSSTLGSFMLSNGYGLRLADGGSTHWNAYVWAPQYVDDGTNTWSEGGLWSSAYGFYQGGGANRCIVSSPGNEKPVPASDTPAVNEGT